MNTSLGIDLGGLLQVLNRRKTLIIAVFFVVVSLAAYLAISLPSVYRSSTLILITPQRLPSTYVTTTVTSEIENRIQTISQQILSRTSLEKIIEQFNLYPSDKSGVTMEERVARLRRKIRIDIRRNDTFELSFDAEAPEKAKQVTARLASLFIEENLRFREQQAAGTTTFINSEVDRLRKEVDAQEAEVNQFRARYRYELPDQLDRNQRMLEQLRRDIDNGEVLVASLQEKKANLEKQIVESELIGSDRDLLAVLGAGSAVPAKGGIESRKMDLETLLGQYSEKHPDVIRLRREIENLKNEEPVEEAKARGAAAPAKRSPRLSLKEMMNRQIQDLQRQMESVRAKNERLRDQIPAVQARVDNTPARAIEFSKVSRDYDVTVKQYQDLLAKGLDSELSENMEKRHKADQFRVVDPPGLPQTAVAPNRQRLFFLGLLLAFVAGLGAPFLAEKLNTSFQKNEDLDGYMNAPLLAALPPIATRGGILEQRRAQGMLVLGSAGALMLGLILIRLFGSTLPVF